MVKKGCMVKREEKGGRRSRKNEQLLASEEVVSEPVTEELSRVGLDDHSFSENSPGFIVAEIEAKLDDRPLPLSQGSEAPNNSQDTILLNSQEYFESGLPTVSWAQVTESYRRERAIEGLLVGSAVGDALGLHRRGLSRRSAASMFGLSSINYRTIPGIGLVSKDTHRMLMAMQATLRSRSQLDKFRDDFAKRLKWYLLTVPVTAGRATNVAALKLWTGVSSQLSGVASTDGNPLVSAIALATVLQGTGHSVERWIAASTKLTHASEEVLDAALLVAHTAHMALMVPHHKLDSLQVLEALIRHTKEPSLNELLAAVRIPLRQGKSVYGAQQAIAAFKGTPVAHADETAVLAVYAWLRHPNSFRRAVTSAIRIGGDSSTLAALVGGFAGIHLGSESIPKAWSRQLSTWPQNRRWIARMTSRLTDWPHGSEDLHQAPSLPVYPIRQLFRSCGLAIGVGIGAVLRFPWLVGTWLDRR